MKKMNIAIGMKRPAFRNIAVSSNTPILYGKAKPATKVKWTNQILLQFNQARNQKQAGF